MPNRVPYHKPPGAGLAKQAARREYDEAAQRKEDKRFYCSTEWRKLRAWFLGRHPLCVDCEKNGRLVEAKHVDHIIPRKQRPDLAFDEANLQGLCASCHNSKRPQENGRGEEPKGVGGG